jgi:hypothetical protein
MANELPRGKREPKFRRGIKPDFADKLPEGSKRLRGKIMETVKQRQKTLKATSPEPGTSYRKAKRVCARRTLQLLEDAWITLEYADAKTVSRETIRRTLDL